MKLTKHCLQGAYNNFENINESGRQKFRFKSQVKECSYVIMSVIQ